MAMFCEEYTSILAISGVFDLPKCRVFRDIPAKTLHLARRLFQKHRFSETSKSAAQIENGSLSICCAAVAARTNRNPVCSADTEISMPAAKGAFFYENAAGFYRAALDKAATMVNILAY